MTKYKHLLKYISYFEDTTIQFFNWDKPKTDDGVIYLMGPNYDERLIEFINDVYDSGIMKTDYIDCLENHGVKDLKESIDDANLDLLRAILTYYVRQERFHDGLWADAVEEKVFLKVLYRLKRLMEVK